MKRVWIGWSVVVLVLGIAGAVQADDNKADFGLRGGYQRFPDLGEGNFEVGAFLRLPWRSVILGEGAVFYHSKETGDADFEFIPIQLSLMLFVLRRDMDFCPYLMAGTGTYISRRIDKEDDETDTQVDIGWHLGFGLDYMLNDRVFIEGDLRYVWLDVDFEGRTVGETLGDFSNWLASVGIGFRL